MIINKHQLRSLLGGATNTSPSHEKLLQELYFNPKTGFISAQKLYEKAMDVDPTITLQKVKDWYASEPNIQQHTRQKDRFKQFKITNTNPDAWQIDLAFWDEKRPILTAINVNSRLGYAKLLPNKNASTVSAAIHAFIRKFGVQIITSDNGSEFMNRMVASILKQAGVEHYNNEPGEHNTLRLIASMQL